MTGATATVTAVVTALVVGSCAPIAIVPALRRHGVLDTPSVRSLHVQPTVRGVGVATAAAVLLAAVVGWVTGAPATGVLVLLGGVTLAVLGLVEDVGGLPVGGRLVLQAALATGAVTTLVVITGGRPPGAEWLALPILVPVLAMIVVGYINAANFMDGIDGISGLHGMVAGGAYALTGTVAGEPALLFAGGVTAAAFTAFLPWNLRTQPVFLGDSGSYLLGSLVALDAVLAWLLGTPVLIAVAPTLVYLADTATTVLRRSLRRERVWAAHSDHVYQQLVRQGHRHVPVALLVSTATALCVLAGLLSGGSWVGLVLAVAVCLFYLAGPRLVSRGRLGVLR